MWQKLLRFFWGKMKLFHRMKTEINSDRLCGFLLLFFFGCFFGFLKQVFCREEKMCWTFTVHGIFMSANYRFLINYWKNGLIVRCGCWKFKLSKVINWLTRSCGSTCPFHIQNLHQKINLCRFLRLKTNFVEKYQFWALCVPIFIDVIWARSESLVSFWHPFRWTPSFLNETITQSEINLNLKSTTPIVTLKSISFYIYYFTSCSKHHELEPKVIALQIR